MTQNEQSIVVSEAIQFSAWKEQQDFDYHRTDSEVVDYLNKFVDYGRLDTVIENSDDTVEWKEELSDVSGISQDSDEFDAAEKHITTYITNDE